MVHTKINHKFENEALSYDAKPNYQPCIKLSFWFRKLPEVSDEQFHRHWETVHADLTIATRDFNVCRIQRYVQFHQTPELKEKAQSLGLEHLDFDGCSEIWVKSWDDWVRFYQSEEYSKALAPDCKHFMAMPIHVAVGYENVIYGEGHPDTGGKNGVTEATLQLRDAATGS
ncbi:hypothetical protein LTR37_014306 [Vermiconidia calcicola]|uniref:Uncharacterized protein n=1 Tax=Vermiconidia calcicola TaxID=1690605 RepID=A0ACC3MVI3_9PEZI|nr:hypothetical protein LTR37_014306 [Vermiconidia calcicola]